MYVLRHIQDALLQGRIECLLIWYNSKLQKHVTILYNNKLQKDAIPVASPHNLLKKITRHLSQNPPHLQHAKIACGPMQVAFFFSSSN